jgi:hypothetical protein
MWYKTDYEVSQEVFLRTTELKSFWLS